ERQVVQAEHVEGGHGRHREAHEPDPAAVAADLEGGPQDLVLGEEAREQRHARDGQAAHEHRPPRPGQLVLQTAHAAHVLLAGRATMDTAAVTMVAAWMSAETGVGPSMASGSQTYSGIWADLPVAPMNSSSAMVLSTPHA